MNLFCFTMKEYFILKLQMAGLYKSVPQTTWISLAPDQKSWVAWLEKKASLLVPKYNSTMLFWVLVNIQ